MSDLVKLTVIKNSEEFNTAALLQARCAIFDSCTTERLLIEDNETGEVLFDFQNRAVRFATDEFMQKLLNFHSWGAK